MSDSTTTPSVPGDTAPAAVDLAALQPRLRRESLVFAAIFSLALFGLSLVLIAWRTEQLLTQLSQDRVVRLLQQVADEGERGMQFGVDVADQASLVERLQRMQSEDKALRAVFVETDRGDPVAMAGDEALRSAIDARWSAPLLSGGPDHPPSVRTTGRGVFAGTAMFDSTGAPAATIWAAMDPAIVRQQAHDAATSMVLKALPLIAGTLFLTWWALIRWGSRVMESSSAPAKHAARKATARPCGWPCCWPWSRRPPPWCGSPAKPPGLSLPCRSRTTPMRWAARCRARCRAPWPPACPGTA